jgi:5'-phosphate synthase pdxT subunit
MVRVGVLGLQGGFEAHAKALRRLGVDSADVRRCEQLRSLEGLILPGGETTTLLNLMRDEDWFDALRRFHVGGGWLLGTCAGAILLAREVTDPVQPSLGLLDATVRRNAYGPQVDSFETKLELVGSTVVLPAVFIRAPRFVSLGSEVEVLATFDGEPVLVRQGRVFAATYHPELTDDLWLHRLFVEAMGGQTTGDSRRQTKATMPSAVVEQERRILC